MNIAIAVFGMVVLLLTVLMCRQESQKRKIHFAAAMAICIIVSPLIGYFIITGFALRNPKGCKWCGNQKNEAEFCGVCGKNEDGLTLDKVKAEVL